MLNRFARLFAPATRSTSKTPRKARLGVEPLEGRAVPAFLTPTSFSGAGTVAAVGYVDNDLKADLVVAGGTPVGSTSTPFSNAPNATMDVIAINGTAAVYLSRGDGTFGTPVTVSGAKGDYLVSLAVRDVNGDGHADVVLTAASKQEKAASPAKIPKGGTTSGGTYEYPTTTQYQNVWLGKGDGTFGRVNTTSSSGSYYYNSFYNAHTATADFDRDGRDDRVSVDGSSPVVSVSLGNGDGTYQPPQTYAAGSSPDQVVVGDFNGDGWADVLVVNLGSSSNSTFSVLLNDGNW